MKSLREIVLSLLHPNRPITSGGTGRPRMRVREAFVYILVFATAVLMVGIFLRWHIARLYMENFRGMAMVESLAAGLLIMLLAGMLMFYRRHVLTQVLTQEGEKFRALLESAPDAIYIIDPSTFRILRRNRKAAELDGYSGEDMARLTATDLHPSEDHALLREWFEKGWEGSGVLHLHTLRRKDGQLVPVEESQTLVDAGDERLVLSIVHDITERKRAEEALRRAHESLQGFVDANIVGIVITDPSGRVIDANDYYLRTTGYTRQELEQGLVDWRAVTPPEWLPADERAIAEMRERGTSKPYEKEYLRRDKTRVWAFISDVMLPGPWERIASFVLDITERKRAEEALRESDTGFRTLAESVPQLVWKCTPDGLNIYFNQRWVDYTGLTLEESYGRGWNTPFHPDDKQPAWNAWNQAVETGGVYSIECRLRRADGAYHWFLTRGVPLRDATGSIVKWFGTCTDIDELKRAEEALRNANAYNRSLIEASLDPLVTISADGNITDVNSATEKVTGLSREALVGKDFSNYFTDPDKARAGYLQVFSKGTVSDYELEIRHREGHLTPVSYSASLYRDESGKILGVFAAARDMTDRKQAEKALAESQALTKAIFESTSDMIWSVDSKDFKLLTFNRSIEDYFLRWCGIRLQAGTGPQDHFPTENLVKRWHELYQRALSEGSYTTDYYVTAAPTVLQLTFNLLEREGKVFGISVFGKDITERKRADEALRESEAGLAAAQRIAHIGSWEWNVQTNEARWSDETYRIFGLEPGHLKEHRGNFLDTIHPKDKARVDQALTEALNGTREYNLEYCILLPDATQKVIHAHAETRRDASGSPLRMQGTVQDITERKRAEEALRESQALTNAIVDSTSDTIWSVDPESYGLLTFNRGLRNYFSERRGILIQAGMRPEDLFPTQDLVDQWRGFYQRALSEAPYATEYFAFAGSVVMQLTFNLLERDGKVFGISVFGKDITERKRAEEALRQSEARLKEALLAAQMGVWEWTAETNTVTWDENLCRIAGRDPKLPAPSFQDQQQIFAPESWERLTAAVENALAIGSPYELDLEMVRPDGSKRWLIARGEALRDASGHITSLRGTIQDITDRKRAEEALMEERHLLHTLMDNLPDLIYFKDRESHFTRINLALASKFHLDNPAQAVGKTDFDFLPAENAEGFEKDDAELLSAGQSIVGKEEKGIWPDGQVTWLSTTKMPLRDADGNISGTFGFSRDITERKRAEEALRDSQERYRDFIQHSNEGVWRVELEQPISLDLPEEEILERILRYAYIGECNLAYALGVGFSTTEEVVGKHLADLFPASDRERWDSFQKAARGGSGDRTVEFRSRDKSGNLRYWLRTQIPIIQDGVLVRVWGITRDITEVKRAEEGLVEERHLLHTLMDNLPDMIYFKDRESRFIRINLALAKMFDLDHPAQAIGKTDFDFFPAEHANEFYRDEEKIIRTGQPIVGKEEKVAWPDGQVAWDSTTKMPLRDANGNTIGTFGVSRDITERKRAAEALQASETRFRTLIERAPVAISISRNGLTLFVNQEYLELYGFQSVDELLGRSIGEQWSPASRCMVEERARQRALGLPVPARYEAVGQRKDGSQFPVEVAVAVVDLPDGPASVGFLTDITERERAEEALRKSEERFRLFMNNSPTNAWMKDEQGHYVYLSQTCQKSLGVRLEDWVGKTDFEVYPHAIAEVFRKNDLAALAAGHSIESVEKSLDRDGEPCYWLTYKFPLQDASGQVLVAGIGLDITERRRADAELKRLNRALRSMTECNQVIARATEESRLLENVCEVLVREGGYRMAWVGYAEHDEGKAVFPIAHSGFEEGYLQAASITWADTDRGRGPMGTAIRTGKPVVARNIQTEPGLALWREEQLKLGYFSSITLPIFLNDRVLGALAIFAGEPDAFDSEEIQLLTELSNDLAFGIHALRTSTERARAEEALKEERHLLHTLMDNVPDYIYFKDRDSRFTRINLALVKGLGLQEAGMALGKTDFDFFPEEDARQSFADDQEIIRTGLAIVGKEEGGAWPGGRVTWLSTTKMPVRDAGGNIVGTFGVSRDITAHKDAEEALRESEDRFRATFENAGIGMALVDLQGHPIKSNPALQQMFGYSQEELSRMAFTEFTHPDDRELDWALYSQVTAGKRDRYEIEKRFLNQRGGVVWGLLTVSLLKDRVGRPTHAVGMVQDITERKRAEAALRDSEARFRSLVQNATVGIYRTTPQGRILTANPALVSMLGFKDFEELASRNLEEDGFEPNYPRREFRERMEQEGEVRGMEEAWTRQDDSIIFVRESARALRDEDGKILCYDGIVEDITERKRAEEALRLTQFSVERASDAIFWMDSQGRILYVNEAACRSLGRSREELLSLSIPDIDPLTPKEAWEASWDADKACGSRVIETQHQTKEGRVFPVEVTANYLNFGGKEYSFAFVRDLTERKRAEAEHIRLVTAIEQSAEAVMITNTAGDVEYVNPAFTRITGYSREEVLGQNPRILKSGTQDPAFYQQLWAAILQGKIWRGELINRRKDGSLYHEQMNIAPVRGERGEVTHFIATKQDVTDRKQLEQQFLQAQKMEAVGRLAGGVAHDFNNLLTIINGYAQILIQRSAPQDPRRGLFEEIQMAGERAASLTRQLLAFSRRQVMEPRVLDISSVLANTEKMLRRLIGEDVELATNLKSGLPRVKVDPGQIEQVIMNLAVNARDAMPRGGKFLIETSSVDVDEDYARSHSPMTPGKYVLVVASDTGCGMDLETQAHIFEPFFTTKAKGQGTGLGLATVYGIIKQSGGFIWIYSAPGQGATFKIYFPCVEEAAPTAELAGARRPTKLGKGKETILVVEDEMGVRSLVCETLKSKGYNTLEAEGAAQALKIAEQHTKPIHLLLTDVVMPVTGGKELAQRLSTLHPESKVLYMSGYTDDAVVRHGISDGGAPLLQKPFLPNALLQKVREVLKMKPRTSQ